MGEYPAYIACNIFTEKHATYVEEDAPRVVQDGGEGQYPYAYIKKICDGTTIGFKYFDCKGVKGLRITTRAYANGKLEVRNEYGGKVLGVIEIGSSNIWTDRTCTFDENAFPDGKQALYLTYKGTGAFSFRSFEILH